MGICFVLKGYDIFESDDIYEGAEMWQINNYSNLYGKESPNSFNVYITQTLSAGNGVTYLGHNKLGIKRSHFTGTPWGTIAGVVLAHELGHTFYLYHPWGNNNEGSFTPEHVTRDPNDSNYNALSVADFIHDTPAQIAFWKEAQMNGVTIYDIIDPDICEYLGNETDNIEVSVEVAKTYKLEIIALADGYKDYAEIEVSLKPNVITTLYPNPTSNQVTVAYKINDGNSAYLSVTGFYGSNVSNNYILDIEKMK